MSPNLLTRTPIYYINLASRPERRAFMEAQFGQLGIEAERIEAVTTDEVPAELLAFHSSPECLWRSNRGDLACGLSHQRAWQRFLDTKEPAALILEDDAILTPPLLDFLQEDLLERMGADIIKLETFRKPSRLGSTIARAGDTELKELCSPHLGAAAYLISRATVIRSLQSPLVRQLAVDWLLFGRTGPHLLRSRILQAWPSPCIQLDRLDRRQKADEVAVSSIRAVRWANEQKRFATDVVGRTAAQLDYLARRAALAFRDPRAAFRPRVLIPFAGDKASPD